MSEPLPPARTFMLDQQGYTDRAWRRWFEGVDRAVGTPPEEGSTGTAGNYDVGTSGGRVPVLAGGTVTQPNIWSGWNVYTTAITSQVGYKVLGFQVVGVQQPAIANPTGGATVDAECRAKLVEVLNAMRTHGLISS